MPPLHAIVYVSTARQLLAAADVERLLEGARRRNASVGVTGVLLYNDGSFMQYLEGPCEGVRTVYDRIQRDVSHGCLIELMRDTPPQRLFEHCPMAYRDSPTGAMPGAAANALDAALMMPSRSPCVAPEHSLVLALLSHFWGLRRPLAEGRGGAMAGLAKGAPASVSASPKFTAMAVAPAPVSHARRADDHNPEPERQRELAWISRFGPL
ncbi:MAG: hypothetical protein RJA98_2892 [Pseudomonadota bacterium]